MTRELKLKSRMYSAMCKLKKPNEYLLMLWQKWRNVTKYEVFGLRK